MAAKEPCAIQGCGITHIYHITHADNLATIIAHGGLYSHNAMIARGIRYVDIAYRHIQSRRLNKEVPIEPYGVLHDYVPFYFAPRSPMLYVIHKGGVEEYKQGQSQVIYLVSTIQRVNSLAIPFVFTDGHAVVELSRFYNNLDDINKVDWPIMRGKLWYDSPAHNDRKRKRNAEFLIHEFFPYSVVEQIVVFDEDTARSLVPTRDNSEHKLPIYVRPGWYFEEEKRR